MRSSTPHPESLATTSEVLQELPFVQVSSHWESIICSACGERMSHSKKFTCAGVPSGLKIFCDPAICNGNVTGVNRSLRYCRCQAPCYTAAAGTDIQDSYRVSRPVLQCRCRIVLWHFSRRLLHRSNERCLRKFNCLAYQLLCLRTGNQHSRCHIEPVAAEPLIPQDIL